MTIVTAQIDFQYWNEHMEDEMNNLTEDDSGSGGELQSLSPCLFPPQ